MLAFSYNGEVPVNTVTIRALRVSLFTSTILTSIMTSVCYAIAGPGMKGWKNGQSQPNLNRLGEEEAQDFETIRSHIITASESRLKLEMRHILYYKVLVSANCI